MQGVFTVTNNHSLIVSQLKAGVINVRDGSETKAPARLSLGIQVRKQYPLWGLKYINSSYFGLFGSPGLGSHSFRTAPSPSTTNCFGKLQLTWFFVDTCV